MNNAAGGTLSQSRVRAACVTAACNERILPQGAHLIFFSFDRQSDHTK